MFIKTIVSIAFLGLACAMFVPAGLPLSGYDLSALAKQGGSNDAGSGTTDRSRDRERCCDRQSGNLQNQTKIYICKTQAKTRSSAIAFCTKKLGKSVTCAGKQYSWTCK